MIIFRKIPFYLALAGIAMGIALVQKLGSPPPKPQPVAEPAINPYADAVAASGIVESTDRNVAIGTPQSGLVADVMVKVWDPVTKGQPLFQIDARELQALLPVQEANVAVAEETVKRLEDQLARLESVSDPRAVSVEELKTRRHDVNVAAAQLEASRAQMLQTDTLIARLTVCAPKDGVILQSNIRQGEYAATGSSTPAMLLGNLDRLQVRADIDEQNANRITATQSAVAFPKNNTSLAIPLHFERIEPYVLPKKSLTGGSEEKVDTRVLQVIYSFDKLADFNIYVGQQVDVFIQDK
jgi:HlyD family secretion protein